MQRASLLAALAIALTACQEKHVVTALKPPPERLECVGVSGRPKIPAEHVIDWTKVTTVPQARAEHDQFVAVLRTRENIIAGYIVQIEGRLFACSSNAQWLREFYARL